MISDYRSKIGEAFMDTGNKDPRIPPEHSLAEILFEIPFATLIRVGFVNVCTSSEFRGAHSDGTANYTSLSMSRHRDTSITARHLPSLLSHDESDACVSAQDSPFLACEKTRHN